MENKNLDFTNELTSILTYLKLVYIEKITKDKSYDTFKMLGGETLFDTLVDKKITLFYTNIEVLDRFNTLLNEVISEKVSLSNILIEDIKHLDWLEELELIPNALLIDTIYENASISLYEKKIEKTLTEPYLINNEKKTMVKCKNIIKSIKDINNVN